MSGGRHKVQPVRATPLLAAACVTFAAAVAWFVVNWTELRMPLVVGWLPVPTSTAVATYACWWAGRSPGLARETARVWRQLAGMCALVTLAGVSNTVDAIVGPDAPTRQYSAATVGLSLLAMLYLLWTLVRLPGMGNQRERLVRFILDAITIAITLGLFVWYYAMRHLDGRQLVHREVLPLVVMVLVGFITALAFVKVAISGFANMDLLSVRLLALGTALGAAGGALTPLLGDDRLYLSCAQFSLPVSMVVAAFAADRQRRAAGIEHFQRPRRPFSIVPYAGVAATDCLLLVVGAETGPVAVVVAVAAVGLTAVVVIRQLRALRENGRLLVSIDANLAELSRYQAELTHRANHDDLTNLANRALFEQESRRLLGTVGLGEGVGVALIDLDDFKAINDRLGHTAGDALLVVVAQRLRECLRRGDIVARLGGDEFGLLLPGLRGERATEVLDQIGQALARPINAGGRDLLVRASIGLAEAWPGAGPQELLRRADVAMYAAKERGKGCYAVYDAQMEQNKAADAQLGAELRQALDRGELSLVYQPIVRLPDGAWTGVETLVRWRHPERGMLQPDVFIRIAERTGLIVPLGDWILRSACWQAASWLERFGDGAPGEVGVNVSARQLREPDFAEGVANALADTGLAPGRLTLEVTETAVFDGGVALDTLRAAADLGVGVALDDFGTGHSSLGLLRTCPADTLKVDKSFVDGIGGTTEEAVIATAMIQITDALHLQAIAEGVETAEQAETLYRLGYRFAQGYYFARPMTAAQVEEHLEAARPGRRRVIAA